jgi:glycosyltransferase involved in cell wall biosynthesis
MIRVLHSFPHRIGAGRICTTAWYQAAGADEAGADVLLFPASVHRPLPGSVRVRPTLERGRWRVPYRVVGHLRAFILHDRLVARALPGLARHIDVVHAWPLGALETLRVARRLGIPTLLERPNAHTRFAYETVARECGRLGLTLPPNHDHAFNAARLEREESEYAAADALLCPSQFVTKTFLERGIPGDKLVSHTYGYDDSLFFPPTAPRDEDDGLTVLFAGECAVRKGLHHALEAWLQSPASANGSFLVAGDFLPAYADRLAGLLDHPSVCVLGHREDVPELMRQSDVLVLPSIEEGFGLVCIEAMASGCVPLASDACTDEVVHGVTGLVHSVGDVGALSRQFTALSRDPELLSNLREGAVQAARGLTWSHAGCALVAAYERVALSTRPRVSAEPAA